VHFDDLFILKDFLFEVEVILIFVLIFLPRSWLTCLKRLLMHKLLKFFLNFISKLIPGKILFSPDNIVFTFTHMNHIGVSESLISLLFVMNVRQVGWGFVFFTAHQSASGLRN
jgi:hypothetical protein